jgi:CubicO group peptidase (beta-lactamase class C family)
MFAHQLMELFKIQKLDKINVILNAVPDMGSLYGYGYGYGYGYSYGYGGYYSDEDSSPWWKRWLSRFKFKNKKHGD